MAGKAFKPNKQGLDALQRELTKEMARRPIRVPIVAESSGVPRYIVRGQELAATAQTVYNGPVVINNGDGVQVAVNAENVQQVQSNARAVPDEFAELAEMLGAVLAGLPDQPLSEEDRELAEEGAREALEEMVRDEPRVPVIRRGAAAVRAALRSLVGAGAAGAADAVTASTEQWATGGIQALTQAIEQLG
ncbi:hypothetical protein [uncultured Modestobacter sp.]|uniref:hypothetical protein n=1 Tax=uncultured Modestobacter sp. TaxID=380048 RepID=UPI002614D19D|nr:hypothetical protein [uncultured Modestobacter sp.]